MSSVTTSTIVQGERQPSTSSRGLKTRTSGCAGRPDQPEFQVPRRGRGKLRRLAKLQVFFADAAVVLLHELRQRDGDLRRLELARVLRNGVDQVLPCSRNRSWHGSRSSGFSGVALCSIIVVQREPVVAAGARRARRRAPFAAAHIGGKRFRFFGQHSQHACQHGTIRRGE